MTKIKYPVTAYCVRDTLHYGADDRGALEKVIFKGPPDTSKLHHFDDEYHKIEGNYFYIVTAQYDDITESKFYLNKEEAQKEADKLTSRALKGARELVKKLERQDMKNKGVK